MVNTDLKMTVTTPSQCVSLPDLSKSADKEKIEEHIDRILTRIEWIRTQINFLLRKRLSSQASIPSLTNINAVLDNYISNVISFSKAISEGTVLPFESKEIKDVSKDIDQLSAEKNTLEKSMAQPRIYFDSVRQLVLKLSQLLEIWQSVDNFITKHNQSVDTDNVSKLGTTALNSAPVTADDKQSLPTMGYSLKRKDMLVNLGSILSKTYQAVWDSILFLESSPSLTEISSSEFNQMKKIFAQYQCDIMKLQGPILLGNKFEKITQENYSSLLTKLTDEKKRLENIVPSVQEKLRYQSGIQDALCNLFNTHNDLVGDYNLLVCLYREISIKKNVATVTTAPTATTTSVATSPFAQFAVTGGATSADPSASKNDQPNNNAPSSVTVVP
ncbi:hypothetical protein AYO45_03490 [Gammaproteobacteria bacterium SCGC AG-212-F23]|nr:hypothetical protein AYO45_03490 [Gammaproteobacteria bacterium SCGC AG-212-F23]